MTAPVNKVNKVVTKERNDYNPKHSKLLNRQKISQILIEIYRQKQSSNGNVSESRNFYRIIQKHRSGLAHLISTS